MSPEDEWERRMDAAMEGREYNPLPKDQSPGLTGGDIAWIVFWSIIAFIFIVITVVGGPVE